MSYFSPNKTDRNPAKPQAASEPRLETKAETKSAAAAKAQETVSTIGAGMLITGNIVATGAVQVFGRVIGDIHAARVVICEGAQVEGKVMAQEAVIDGAFKGTVHANAVKLQSTALVEGEVYNKSLSIEQNAQFEGIARRLEQPIEAPTSAQLQPAPAIPYAPAPSTYVAEPSAYTHSNGQVYAAANEERHQG